MKTMLEICRTENIEALIPGSEAELQVISKYATSFEKEGIRVIINNPKVIDTCTNKFRTYEFLARNHFPYPRTEILDVSLPAQTSVDNIADRLDFPLILKPYLHSGGSQNLFIAQNPKELLFYCDYLAKRNDLQMIVQEYEGDETEEYTIGVLSNLEGKAFSCFILKRLMNSTISVSIKTPNLHRNRIKEDFLTISSGVSQGWVIEDDEIKDFAIKLADRIGSTGPLNLQCRRTRRGIVTFEINPRFSGTTSIRALCGHNDPDIIIQNRLGLIDSIQVPYKKGLVIRGFENNFLEGVTPEK